MAENNSSSGTSPLVLLGTLFVGLKLTHFIDWSWWYVTMPFWSIPLLVLALMVLGTLADATKGKK